ncbi:MAG TPA: hypothetical protein VHX88_10710 [Solirubrobacteraceae bacterium]|nr:hypothetical protein [Solirubrobacteraceae bacterium]
MLLVLVGCLVGVLFAGGTVAFADVYGLTASGTIVRFAPDSPGQVTTVAAVSGLVAGETLRALTWEDVPGSPGSLAPGLLVGVGDRGGVYAIDPSSGAASLLTGLPGFPPGTEQIGLAPEDSGSMMVQIPSGQSWSVMSGEVNGGVGPGASLDRLASTRASSVAAGRVCEFSRFGSAR